MECLRRGITDFYLWICRRQAAYPFNLTTKRISHIIQLMKVYYMFDTLLRSILQKVINGGTMITFEDFILEEDGPIYWQIIRYVKRGIVSGTIVDGEEMISRRALSALLGVNPNTIQKAYHLLEEEGIIRSRTGAKSCIEVDESMKQQIRLTLLKQETMEWVKAMKQMGVDKKEALNVAEQVWDEL